MVPDIPVRFWTLPGFGFFQSLLVRPLEKSDAGSGEVICARNMQRTLFSIKISKWLAKYPQKWEMQPQNLLLKEMDKTKLIHNFMHY